MKTKNTIPLKVALFVTIQCLLLLVDSPFLMADGLWTPEGARSAGLNHSTVAIGDFWSIQNNQAGMAGINRLTIGISYQDQFGMNELAQRSVAVIAPLKWGVGGLSMHYFGFSLYSETKIGVAFARSLGTHFRFGLQLDYLQTKYGEHYGKTQDITFEIGLQADLTHDLRLGMCIFNPVSLKQAEYQQQALPIVFRFGLAYSFSKSLLVTAEAEKNSFINQIVIRSGVEYEINHRFTFRLGFGTYQEIFSMGLGIHLGHLQLDLASRMHASLGFSPQASIQYTF